MKNILLIFLTIVVGTSTLFLTTKVLAYQLVPMLGISEDKKSFFTNMGEEKNIVEGMEGTFTSDNISVIAKAVSVSNKISIWKIIERSAIVPFQKDQVVTFNYATEKIWMFDPNNYLTYKKFQQEEEIRKERLALLKTREGYKHIISVKRSMFNGETISISQTDSSTITSRNGDIFEIMYAYNIGIGFQFGLGYRIEKENLYATEVNSISNRAYIYFDFSYHFVPYKELPHIYLFLGSSLGTGTSKTVMPDDDISGKSMLFPTIYGGLEYFFYRGHALCLEGGVETINTQESFKNGTRQDTSEVNYKIGLGYSIMFK
ncbi:MAG: hypothetical protein HQK49_14960 [Oligoflexia bacterium]|nr:hypothetical protein [Oligoflexia bacterium]